MSMWRLVIQKAIHFRNMGTVAGLAAQCARVLITAISTAYFMPIIDKGKPAVVGGAAEVEFCLNVHAGSSSGSKCKNG